MLLGSNQNKKKNKNKIPKKLKILIDYLYYTLNSL